MFLTTKQKLRLNGKSIISGRNPLKSGQCFLREYIIYMFDRRPTEVAIPSNRVNVSYTEKEIKRILTED